MNDLGHYRLMLPQVFRRTSNEIDVIHKMFDRLRDLVNISCCVTQQDIQKMVIIISN